MDSPVKANRIAASNKKPSCTRIRHHSNHNNYNKEDDLDLSYHKSRLQEQEEQQRRSQYIVHVGDSHTAVTVTTTGDLEKCDSLYYEQQQQQKQHYSQNHPTIPDDMMSQTSSTVVCANGQAKLRMELARMEQDFLQSFGLGLVQPPKMGKHYPTLSSSPSAASPASVAAKPPMVRQDLELFHRSTSRRPYHS